MVSFAPGGILLCVTPRCKYPPTRFNEGLKEETGAARLKEEVQEMAGVQLLGARVCVCVQLCVLRQIETTVLTLTLEFQSLMINIAEGSADVK